MKRFLLPLALLMVLASVGVASAAPVEKGKLTISDVWARSSPEMAEMGAVYLTIENSGKPDYLVFASVPKSIAAKVELHETVPVDAAGDSTEMNMFATPRHEDGDSTTSTTTPGSGATTMQPVTAIDLDHGTTKLEPGGYHIMLIDLDHPLEKGEKFPVTLTFDSIGKVKVTAVVRDR